MSDKRHRTANAMNRDLTNFCKILFIERIYGKIT